MRFSAEKSVLLKTKKGLAWATFLLGLAVAAALFLPYALFNEGYFTFYGDFNAQQIPFYKLCHAAVRSGNFGWNWNTDLGVNFIGSYSFYLLGSPFFWLTIPFPNSFVPYLMGPLLILKFGCAALTAYWYIRRFTRTPQAACLGGLLYAFSGFSIYNIFFNHFHEAIVFFPLLLLSMELLLTENRRGFFALMVAACAVVNYYFFFGMAVFCILYFVVRWVSGAVRIRFSRFCVLAAEAVLGVLLAAFLLLPSVITLTGNYRISELQNGWSALVYGREQRYVHILESIFFPPDIPARPVFCPESNAKWSSLSAWLPIFSLTGVWAYCTARKGSWLKRMLCICCFMAFVPVLNSAFSAFNTSYYARWYYMPILLMCLASAVAVEDSAIPWKSAWIWVFGITVGIGAAVGLMPEKDSEGRLILGLYNKVSEPVLTHLFGNVYIAAKQIYFVRFALALLIAGFSLVALRVLLEWRHRKKTKLFFRAAIASVCVMAVIYGHVFIYTGRTCSSPIKTVMIDSLIEGQVDLPDTDDYRVDTYDSADNTGMYLNLRSIQAFHSIVPGSIMEFYNYIGVQRDVGSRPKTDVPAVRPLLSVKYLLNRVDADSFVNDETGETLMAGYKYLKTSGNYYIYENENYIPYGFSYEYYMTRDYCDGFEEKDRSRLMLKAVLLSDEQIEKYGAAMENLADLTVPTDENGSPLENATTPELSDAAMAVDSANLAKTAASDFTITNTGFSCKVSREKTSLVFFSVPYEAGWSATVNGKAVEIEQVNVGFMAVPVESGNSTIVFTYQTPGLDIGLTVSAGALLIFGLYLLLSFLIKRRYPDKTVYPEGEKLLARWRLESAADVDSTDIFSQSDRTDLTEVDILSESTPDPLPQVPDFKGGFSVDLSAFSENNDTENR